MSISVPATNVAVVVGDLSSEPRIVQLPSGDVLVNYEVSTETAAGRLSVPVQADGSGRRPVLHQGDRVVAVGVVRRRFYRAGGATMSRTEVVADAIGKPAAVSVRKALEAAALSLATATPSRG